MSSRRKLSVITGLKVLATLGIFVWHCGFLKSPDLGARCVEIFLVASGFLTAYNHHGLYTGTFDESIAIVRKKLRAIYPIYLAGFLLAIVYMFVAHSVGGYTRFGLVATAIVHLTLMQAWIPGVSFAFDGAAWFLSAALFCYAMTPVVSRLLCHAKDRLGGSALGAGFVCAGSFTALLFFELCQMKMPTLYTYSVHIAPPLCLLRFMMGYAAACLYSQLREFAEGNKLAFAALELAYCVALVAVVILGNALLFRSVYTALFTGLVLLLALEVGLVAKLLSLSPFIVAGHYELEFYVFHQPCINLADYLIGGMERKALCAFALAVALVYLWRLAAGALNRGKV